VTYESALEYIASLAPRGWRLGLDRMEEFVRRSKSLDCDPSPKFIHVAGTNGKGSTTAMIQSVLIEQGFNTGSFFSPYVVNPRERVQVGRRYISEQELAEITDFLIPIGEGLSETEYGGVTEFEFKTMIGFEFWKRQRCEFVALEVGLGGRLDATNVVQSAACAIVSIGWDHMHILGNSLSEIAFEKAGILKKGVPAVVGKMEPEPLEVIRKQADTVEAPLWIVGKDVHFESRGNSVFIETPHSKAEVQPSLFGEIQHHNAAVAYAAAELAGAIKDPQKVSTGFSTASIPGRFQRIEVGDQEWLFDGAHNFDSAVVLHELLRQYGKKVGICITNMLQGHEPRQFYQEIVDSVQEFYVVPIDFHRAREVSELVEELRPLGKPIKAFETLHEAITEAKERADCSVLLTGSFFLVGEALRQILPK
jgi:dihydrofolate synthase / folylpolyglutamate synthase